MELHEWFGDILQQFADGNEKAMEALVVFCYTSSLRHCFAQLGPQGRGRATPFAGNPEYLVAKEAQYCLLGWGLTAINFNFSAQIAKELETAGVSPVHAINCLMLCQARLEEIISSKLAVTQPQPRVLQLARELRLTDRETEAVTFILICHCGSYAFNAISSPLIPSTIARIVGMTPRELLEFMMETRAHMKQGIVSSSQQTIKPSMADTRLTMQLEVVAALTGAGLTEEQLIKLEKTALAKVVERDGGAVSGLPCGASANGNDDNDNEGIGSEGSFGDFEECSASDGDSVDDDVDYVVDSKTGKLVPASTTSSSAAKALVEQLLLQESRSGGKKGKGSGGGGGGGAAQRKRSAPASPTINSADKEGLPKSKKRDEKSASPVSGASPMAELRAATSRMHQPYTTDIEYIDDNCKALSTVIKIRNTEGDIKDEDEGYYQSKSKSEATMRELLGRERLLKATIASRLEATRKGGKWMPRVEIVATKLKLSEFEKQVLLLLVGNVISHDVLIAINGRYVMRDGQREMTVGYLLYVLCDSLQARVASRKFFFNASPLIKHGIISLSLVQGRHSFNSDLMDYMVDIDRKIVDYLMGEDMETAEMVPGSRLYAPDVSLDKVVLPQATKEAIMSTIEHFDLFARCKRRCGFSEGLGTQSTGLVFLFYGPSGTGKTMLANAIAHTLKRRLLLVNLVSFKSDGKANDVLRFVFREAKLHDAIIFFDECETFFESRETNPMVTSVLAEFEQYDGTIILATNRAQVIDEAMNRRISLMVEFKMPDHSMREQIWRTHLPATLPLDADVSLETIAMDYELSGGLIRNAALTALSRAVAREKSDTPTLRMEDLVHGARLQLRGLFQAEKTPFGSESYITPRRRLEDMVLDARAHAALLEIAKLVKSRNTLFSQWGFDEHEHRQSSLCLFVGPSGTGKSLAAEAIANECGVPIRQTNVAELVAEREMRVQQTFEEAKKLNAIVVFDAAQRLWDHNERSEQLAQLIQYHAVTYPRPVILLATSDPSLPSLDPRSLKMDVKHFIQFQLPDKRLRAQLWRRFIPPQVPAEVPDAALEELAERTHSAKFIQAVCFGACCKVALRHDPAQRRLTIADLIKERDEQVAREQRLSLSTSMFA